MNKENKVINVAFAGNPNCGKTTLFNALTGANLKVANWPGVTVEKKEGMMEFGGHIYKMVDLPGTYSLTSYTMEEIVARNYILSNEVDVIINIVDASSLERNLCLTLQLIELGKPVIIAMNMMDIIKARGMEIDFHRLPEMLGVPVIPVCARKKTGLDPLMHAVEHHADKPFDATEHHHDSGLHCHNHHDEYVMVYDDDTEDKIDLVISALERKYPDIVNPRWHAIKLLEHDTDITERFPLDLSGIADKSLESHIINMKYKFIEEIVSETVCGRAKKKVLTDKIDAVLTHRIFGLPIFFGIMMLVFFLTFTVGDFLKGYFEQALEIFSDSTASLLVSANAADWLISLLVDGIIAGVGGILTFLPNIIILFIALAFLEDSGYMSRVAYVMDGIMAKIGLSGRAFIPMLLGFGCTVPAVMATRALEDRRDRIRTILVTPYMSCSARLPIYLLFSDMFFGKAAPFAALSLYIIGILTAIFTAYIIKKADRKSGSNTLLIELPEYKTPGARNIFIYVWNKVKDYLTKAGTTIFLASLILWVLLNFGFNGTSDMQHSFAADIGRLLAPLLAPAGLGAWQLAVALISGIAAKEVVVSSMGVLFGITNISSAEGMAALSSSLAEISFTAVNGFSMMLFCLLYIPCAATIATIRRESGSLKITLLATALQLGTAWVVSTLFFQIASLIF